MSIWNWISEAYQSWDWEDERCQLFNLLVDANDCIERDVDGALGLYDEGRRLADRLGEKWWALLFDHWKLQGLIFHKLDLVAAQDLAIRAAIEVRKPEYRAFPQRLCLHEDLIHVYENFDPIGNDAKIVAALDYMEGEVGPDYECRHCLAGLRAGHCTRLGDYEKALEFNRKAGQLAAEESSDHHLAGAYSNLCDLLNKTGQWGEPFLEVVQAGLGAAHRADRPDRVREFSAWEALVLRKLGREEDAGRAWERCLGLDARLESKPDSETFDAMAGYFEAAGELEAALAVRDRQSKVLEGSGFHFALTCCQVERLLLKRALGRMTDADIATVRAAAESLVDRGWVERLLSAVLQ